MYVWRNIQPRSRDYCCCGKAITVTYLVRVSVALVIRHAMHAIKLEHISFFHSLERYTYSHLTSLLHATMYQNLHSTHKYSDNGGKHHVVGVAWCRPNHDPITNAHPHTQSEEGKRARHNITCFESKIYYRHFAVTQVMRLDSGQVFSTWGMVTPWKNSSPNRNVFYYFQPKFTKTRGVGGHGGTLKNTSTSRNTFLLFSTKIYKNPGRRAGGGHGDTLKK